MQNPVQSLVDVDLSRPSSRASLERHYLSLGRRSRRLRFLGDVPDESLRRLARDTRPDAVFGVEVNGVLRGVLEIYDTGCGHAEIGISIEDSFQGMGYGRRVFLYGLAHARRMGVRTADLYFSRDNTGIAALIRMAGGRIHYDGTDAFADIDLERLPSCPDARSGSGECPEEEESDHGGVA